MDSSIINGLGAGSGIDTAKLVDELANASRQPKADLFAKRLQTVQAKISSVAQARSDLESFAKSLTDLVAGGSLQSQPALSDPNALSATAAIGAQIGSLDSQIEIDQLASAQTIYSNYIPDATAPIGQGSMTLAVGGQNYAITIDASHDSLNGLATAINATGSGVTATVLTDSSGSRLVLRGQSGSANAFSLTTSDAALQSFAYGSGGGMTLGQAAQDAKFTVDSVAYTRSSNTVGDVIPGVTLTLRKATPGELVSITTTRPTDTLKQTLNDFVNVYNTLKKDMAAARTATGDDGALRSLDRQLSSLLTTSLTSNTSLSRLSDIGISTNRDGTISLDSTKLNAALTANPDAVEALFSPTRDATHNTTTDPGIALALQQLTDNVTGSSGVLEGLKNRLDQESSGITKDQASMEDQEASYKSRLEQQFGTLDSRLSALKATQSYLQQQVKVWTNSNGSN